MARDPYQDFADVYDEWQALYPRPFSLALAPKVRGAIREFAPARPVLADLACGTGTFASWWQRTHPRWSVYGTDRSAAMIRRARTAADGLGRAVPRYMVQDLAHLSLPEPVGVATCLFDSLNHVTRTAELKRILGRVREALVPGGLFLFDLIDETEFPQVFTGASILWGKHLYVGIETEYAATRRAGMGAARFTFFRRSGSRWRRIEFRIRERRWVQTEVRELLAGARLDCLRVLRLNPYESDEFIVPRTFWICRRGE